MTTRATPTSISGSADPRARRSVAAAVAASLLLAACSSDAGPAATGPTSSGAPAETASTETASTETVSTETASGETASGDARETSTSTSPARFRYPRGPLAPAADVQSAADVLESIDAFVRALDAEEISEERIREIGDFGDPRHAWFLADLLRFFGGAIGDTIVESFEELTGVSIADDPDSERSPYLSVNNHLIAWDTPDYPGYREDKASIYLRLEPRWEPFFSDEDADIDWRLIGFGGVLPDARVGGDGGPCSRCIPALDDPAVTDATGGDWYPDDRIVFGVVVGDEALAIPKNIAEVHEMFNLTLGGRRLGIPYCTLCGSAQAYFTDGTVAPETPVLRTSGLLSRSNKVMYDVVTWSVFDTFTGDALSGPLQDLGVTLEETTVVSSTWAEWKAEHPDTMIVAEDGGIGRAYELDPLRGRDDDGPIFPIGDVDERLGVQDLVVGVIAADGTPVAFPSERSRAVIGTGGEVTFAGVTLVADAGGLRAVDSASGEPLPAHESFWFAWSQFHPETELLIP